MDRVSISDILTIIAIIFGFVYVQWQIQAMRLIEKEKRVIAIIALIGELEYNKEILLDYVDHWWIGGHSNTSRENKSPPTYDLQTPRFINYEQFLPFACFDNKLLSKEISNIYLNCDACKVIINQLLSFISNNQLNKGGFVNTSSSEFEKVVVNFNKYNMEVSRDTYGQFDKVITELTRLKDSINFEGRNPKS